jgi:hypothetical protein
MSQANTTSARLRDVEESIKGQPIKALAVAALVGFVVGGGYRSRLGISLLGFVGRTTLRKVAFSALSEAINNDRNDRDREPSNRGSRKSASNAETD